MEKLSGMTKRGRNTIIIAIVLIFIGVYWFTMMGGKDIILPQGRMASTGEKPRPGAENTLDEINISVNTWGGFIPGQYFNRGFKSSTESRYWREFGLRVNFILNDEFTPTRDAWKKGEVDLIWATADAISTEINGLLPYNPKIILQADWSWGGDVIVAVGDIKSVADLRGRKIAYVPATPSHTLLTNTLKAGQLEFPDIKSIKAETAIQAAEMFKAGRVDAAVIWSPDDQVCLQVVQSSHVLTSTKEARYTIADVFFGSEEFIRSHQEELKLLLEGWFIGAAEINSSKLAKDEAVKILSQGLGVTDEFALIAINNTRLCTYGDNENFFGLNMEYRGIKGEDLYIKMGRAFQGLGEAPSNLPAWRMITDLSPLQAIHSKIAGQTGQEAYIDEKFLPAPSHKREAPAFSTVHLTVSFPTGSAILDQNAKIIIDGFSDVAKSFPNHYLRIEGNTDSTGSYQANMLVSERRAESVANYLSEEYGWEQARFITVGNGPGHPIASNDTAAGRAKNRRTDFELVPR